MRHSFFLLFFRYHLASVLHSTYLWAYHVHWTLEFMTEAFIWNRTIRVKYTVLKNWKGELLKNWNGTDAIEVTSFRASLWESFSQLNWITFVNSTGEEKTNFFWIISAFVNKKIQNRHEELICISCGFMNSIFPNKKTTELIEFQNFYLDLKREPN